MYIYAETSPFSGKKGSAFLAVIMFHIVIGYGFYTGLKSGFIGHVVDDLTIKTIPMTMPIDKIEIPRVKPNIEFRKLDVLRPEVPPAPTDEGERLFTRESKEMIPLGPVNPETPVAHSVTIEAAMDPRHPLLIGDEYYPDSAKRNGEEGRCIVQMTVAADGRITDSAIQTSSGVASLDRACLKSVRGQHMLPATVDGKPIERVTAIPIRWRIVNK